MVTTSLEDVLATVKKRRSEETVRSRPYNEFVLTPGNRSVQLPA